jgi:UDP-3-O-[3-hydroxymyristoyl] N-acetylglucosamine deacetylase
MKPLQQTIAKPVKISGTGLHTANPCDVYLCPAKDNTGIQFSFQEQKPVKITPLLISHSQLCTAININGSDIYTTEHLLAAITGLGIDNIIIKTNGTEIPILDGSAIEWIKAIQSVGIKEQHSFKAYRYLTKEIEIKDRESTLIAQPDSSLQITVTLDFPHPLISKEPITFIHSREQSSMIWRARTFGFFSDRDALQKQGYAKGATTENCLIFTINSLYKNQKMRFPEEPVYHKILDFLGDLTILNSPLIGRFTLHRPSHRLTHKFVRLLMKNKELLTTDENSIY